MSRRPITRPALHALSLIVLLAGAQTQAAEPTFSIEVVADCNRFIATPNPNGPEFGDFFMQEGLIYRPGTLEANCPGGTDCGLNPDGTPEFPAAVIGKWTCWGSFVGNGAATEAGTWLYSTQLYEFDVNVLAPNVFEPGKRALASHGAERTELGVPFPRAITGGYGRFQAARGEVEQTRIGLNQTQCGNFTFAFRLQPPREPVETADAAHRR